ncbi:methyl-accepting chemotaxis protein [Otoolea muris]|uniref:methyl-accepting chemotaxis protein n=1 Tax=Otoolea muris TaxID=2941515 RepID=UPI002040DCE6|nr:methyl-accepting chemotaxis protein [Otoolea muris]
MSSQAKIKASGTSLSTKIISKIALMIGAIFLVTIAVSSSLSARSQLQITNEKLVSVAYENSFLIANNVEASYAKATAFADSLRNISALDPKEQRDAIDNALVGILEGNKNFTTVFAYFEQNTVADANGDPYSVHRRDIAYEAVAYPDPEGSGYLFEKHEDAFDTYEKAYYQQIKSTGEPYLMEPYVYELMGKEIMMISVIAPIHDTEGNFMGVAGMDVALDDLQSMRFAGTGYESAHMVALAEDGTILVDTANPAAVGKPASDTGYAIMSKAQDSLSGMPPSENANSLYVLENNITNFATKNRGISVSVPLTMSGGNQWMLYLSIDKGEFYGPIISDIVKLSLAIIVFGILMLCIVYYIIKKYLSPIQTIMDGAARLEAGDLNIHIDVRSRDELGRLAQAFNHISTTMNNYVHDISIQLSEMANNNLDINITQKYIGDFIPIQDSIEKISCALNNTLHQINSSADAVAQRAESMSVDAHGLAKSVLAEAQAIEELTTSIGSLSKDMTANADHAQKANETVLNVKEQIVSSNHEMSNLVSAMSDIRQSSSEIQKIVGAIQGIADQTNLLSLNASVEASRAGEAGKTFAVVAKEIRDLAARSADAVKQTEELIHASHQAVERGIRIADDTAKSLSLVVEGANEVSSSVDQINSATQEQKKVLDHLTDHIDLISNAMQTNSASVQGSAGTSTELLGLSKRLYELVKGFRLKNPQR